jgi:hypothetical protein
MDKDLQQLIGKMALLAFLILIIISIIISYACVFMSSTDEMFQNQDRNMEFKSNNNLFFKES